MAELVRKTKLQSVVDRLGNNENSRDLYFRQYYLRNKDNNAELRRANAASSAAIVRKSHPQDNKDKAADYLNRNHEWINHMRRQYDIRKKLDSGENGTDGRSETMAEYRRQNPENRKLEKRRYYLRNNERKADYRIRHGKTMLRYQGEYNSNNKEKVAVYQQGYYNRDGGLVAENRRLGRKEYIRSYFGSQRTARSWKTPESVREYLDSVASRLNISNYADWYRISRKQMATNGGLFLYDKFGNLGTALQFVYPEIRWDLDVFRHRGKKSGQRWLKLKIKELLPGTDIVEDYQHPDLNWVGDSDRSMELDLWIPQHRIGIEYQGQQHYFNVDKLGPSSAAGAYSERDTLKNSLCESQGISLIAIPYWWDGSMDSLSATLYQARPDVFPVSNGRPIPREMPALCSGNNVHQLPEELKNVE